MSINSNLLDGLTGKGVGKEIQGGLLKVRGKILVFANTIYQIPNIASVSVIDIMRPFPILSLLIGLVGLAFFQDRFNATIGIVLLVIAGGWMYSWYLNRSRTGLEIITNAGAAASILIVSKDKEFLTQVAITLGRIMDSEDEHVVANFSIDNRQIKVEGISQSTITVDSKISGDIVNKV